MTSYATQQASGTFANTATTILQAGVIVTGLLGLNPEKVDVYRINATSHYRPASINWMHWFQTRFEIIAAVYV